MLATLLPFIYDPGIGEHGVLLGHLARNNDQWRCEVLGEAMVIVRGPDAYVSPSWYTSKKKHGRVVPTWNYVTAHVYGRLVVHDDLAWVDSLVRRLTDKHEAKQPQPWTVQDTPPGFVAGQLRAIVGIEIVINRVEAKAKLSQNRPTADIDGVISERRPKAALTRLLKRTTTTDLLWWSTRSGKGLDRLPLPPWQPSVARRADD